MPTRWARRAVKAKNQRLILLVLALVAVVGAGSARHVGDARPGELLLRARRRRPPGPAARPGGADRRHGRRGSLHRHPDGVTIDFLVGDETPATIAVTYRGITPDLFREGSGVIAEGRFQPNGAFVASEILAKHDENYMPPRADPARHAPDGPGPVIAEAGLALLWLAASLSLLQLVLGAAALRPGQRAAAARRPAGRGGAGRCWSASPSSA